MDQQQTKIPPVQVVESSTPRPASPQRVGASIDGQVPWRSALAAGAVWVVAIALLDAVAPPADPDAVLSPFEMLLTAGYMAALMVGAVGLAMRQRIGVMASIAGGGLFVLGSVSCWMGGHVGSWIAVQAVLGGAMMLLGTGLLRRS